MLVAAPAAGPETFRAQEGAPNPGAPAGGVAGLSVVGEPPTGVRRPGLPRPEDLFDDPIDGLFDRYGNDVLFRGRRLERGELAREQACRHEVAFAGLHALIQCRRRSAEMDENQRTMRGGAQPVAIDA